MGQHQSLGQRSQNRRPQSQPPQDYQAPSQLPPSPVSTPAEPEAPGSIPEPYTPADIPDYCSICFNPFNTLNPETNTTEKPMLLYCGHIFGSKCLQTWLSTSRHINCPSCRRDQFHDCGHMCEARSLLLPSSQTDPTPAIPPLPKDGILEDDCVDCYTQDCLSMSETDPDLAAIKKELVKKIGIEILGALGEINWKGLSGDWSAVLEQLTNLLSTPTQIKDPRKKRLSAHRLSSGLENLVKKRLERAEMKENEILIVPKDKRRCQILVAAVRGDGVVEMEDLELAWMGVDLFMRVGRVGRLRGLKREYKRVLEEGRERVLRRVMSERW